MDVLLAIVKVGEEGRWAGVRMHAASQCLYAVGTCGMCGDGAE